MATSRLEWEMAGWQRKPEKAWQVYLQKEEIQAKNACGVSL